jgi:hypothetical protein
MAIVKGFIYNPNSGEIVLTGVIIKRENQNGLYS